MKTRDATWLSLFERDENSHLSLTERICSTVRGAVGAGYLGSGDRLPASRVLAIDLQVSRITVEAAYGRLEAEGYVVRRVGDGTFVALTMPSTDARRKSGRLIQAQLSRRGSELVATGGCVDARVAHAFTAGFPDLPAFPHEIWRRIAARKLRSDPMIAMGYGDPQGLPELRSAISSYLFQYRNVQCSPEQIVVTTSSQQALTLIFTLLIDPGDPVWVEDPCYTGAYTALVSAGAAVVGIPVDEKGICVPPASERPAPKIAYLTPGHQYPTGAILSMERRMQIVTDAFLQNTWIVEDDYDSEFRYDAQALPSLQGLDKRGRVIYVGTFSKSMFPSLRIGYMVLPPGLVASFVTARTTQDGHPPYLSQAIAAEFIAEGHFTAHIRQMRRLYTSRCDCLLESLAEHVPRVWRTSPERAGLQVTVCADVPSDLNVARDAKKAGLELACLSPLYIGDSARQGWMLGFSALDNASIRAGAKKLGRLLDGRA
ncbi:MocR-like pyridoxine biosynthesis transcription factor PdxR [Trinickia acidisoli]|uniref:MocR-like pyridoxine biosynthesis transcription factor PdxR n=1 Tax=Trinickia acidisoli TaxID=2767482 RepID=UPI001A8E0DAA|nr:PLP-dependent aminotransferase family protein [Trinickia acidisoli]